MWENSDFQVQQVEKIGKKLGKVLVQGGVTTLALLEQLGPREIEVRTGRNPPFGSKVKDIIQRTIPKFSVDLETVLFLNSTTYNAEPDCRGDDRAHVDC